jgi:hypothetical protein
MRKSATRLLTLATYVTVLVVVPTIAPANAASNAREEEKVQTRSLDFSDPRSVGRARPLTRPSTQAGSNCAGAARSFDCKQWPPSIDEDPDRKAGSAGGM